MIGNLELKGRFVVTVLVIGLAIGSVGWWLANEAQPAAAAEAQPPAAKDKIGESKKPLAPDRPDDPLAQGSVASVDFQGDALPTGAISRLGSARLRHEHLVMDVTFSPDGKTVASAGRDHTVRLWDSTTGKELRLFTTEEDRSKPYANSRWLCCIAFSPDGKLLACGEYNKGWSANTIRIWEAATGKLLQLFAAHARGVPAIAFSPDGSVLASGGADKTIGLWDPATGQALRRLSGHDGAVKSVAFSPEGTTLATAGDDGTIRLWDPATGQELRKLVGHQAEVESIGFSPDGKSLVSGSRDQSVRLWDPATGKEVAIFRGHQEAVLRVAFAADSNIIASGGMDKTIQIWDCALGKKVRSLEGHRMDVHALRFSPNGQTLASASADRRVCLWDVATGKEIHPQPGHQEVVLAIGFLEGGSTLVSVGQDKTMRWWDWRKGKQERLVPLPAMHSPRAIDPLLTIGLAPGRDLFALGLQDGSIQLLDLKSGQERGRLVDKSNPILQTAFSPDGKVLASSDGKSVQFWDMVTRKPLRRVFEDPSGTKFMLFTPDGKLLLAGNKVTSLWDEVAGKPVRDLRMTLGGFASVAFSPDGRLLLCGDTHGQVQMWDGEKGDIPVRVFEKGDVPSRVLPGLAGYVTSLAFSPDGRLLAAGAWRGIKVWELETGQERRAFKDYGCDTYRLAFSPDGRALASGNGDNTILIWDIPDKSLAVDPRDGDGQQVLQSLWKDLAADDGARVHRAIWGLVGLQSKAVTYLKTVLKPARGADPQRLMQLTKDLDSDLFPVREQATKDLQKLGELAEPALRKLLADSSSLEAKLRAKGLLEALTKSREPERLQTIRGVEALEYIGTLDARELLRELSQGAPGVRVSREAAASLDRLAKQLAILP